MFLFIWFPSDLFYTDIPQIRFLPFPPSKDSNLNLNFCNSIPFFYFILNRVSKSTRVNFHTLDVSMLKSSSAVSLHVSLMQVMLMIRVCVFLSLYWLHFAMMMDKGKYESEEREARKNGFHYKFTSLTKRFTSDFFPLSR